MNAQAGQMKEIAGELKRIIGSRGSNGTGKDPGEPVKKAESGWKAAVGRKTARPENLIPFEKSDFKDF
jgi:hypothetical protein